MEKGNEIKTVIPALRFLEFQGMIGWEKIRVKDFGKVITGNTPSKNEETYWNGDFAWITAQDFNGKYIYDSISKLTQLGRDKSKIIPKDSVLVTCIASIGLNAINKIECSTNQQINSICCNQRYYNEYVYYTITYNIHRLKQLAGQTAVPIITKKIFEDFEIYATKIYDEQQKIANCLSSLDDLIEATALKVEALKEHKKGLMQRLFPAEGKNVPDLRFPEFQASEKWKECILGNCLLEQPRYGINAPAVPFQKELPTYIRITDISEDGYFLPNPKVSVNHDAVDNFYLGIGDLVFARTGASVGKCYKYRKEDGKLVFAGFLIKVSPDQTRLSPDFLFQFTFSQLYWKWVDLTSTRSGQPGINSKEFASMMLYLPTKDEQQKIADCFSSLDELIEATSRKVEILKEHKKGLMQQLFPKI